MMEMFHVSYYPPCRHSAGDFVAKFPRVRIWLTYRWTTVAAGFWWGKRYAQFEMALPRFIRDPLNACYERRQAAAPVKE